MKKWKVEVVICTLITCSILTIPITAADPTVLLPSIVVRITAEYGSIYWFDFTLSDVRAPANSYDVKNGLYHGWCLDKDLEMNRSADHPVILKSSLDTDLPSNLNNLPWHEINYIINNRDGYSRNNVQMAIWHLTDGVNLSGYTDSQALINDAEQNGGDFIPQTGDLLAIPIIAAASWLQPAFLELTIPPASIRGFVWYDTNGDGIQDTGENGLGDITVTLYNSTNVSINSTYTTSEGFYTFRNFASGDYYLQFNLKSGYIFTKKDIGNDTFDSDANTTTGKTIMFPADQNVSITIWDAGMYKKSSGGTPVPPEVEPTPNVRPVADATAGTINEGVIEGVINSTITFNGSRSYDNDGRIITYHWNFGDGTDGLGKITTHSYTELGTYNVTLKVTDDKFATDNDTITAQISLGNHQPNAPVLSGPTSAHASISTQYTIVTTDPDGDTIRYIIDWGDGSLPETSPLVESGQNVQSTHQWTTPGFYTIQAKAQDMHMENSSLFTMRIAIDVLYINDLGYLIDNNGDGTFDQYHNNATGTMTPVKKQTNNKYLFDSNGDGTYDLAFDTTTGLSQKYSEQPLLMYIIPILAILVIVFLSIFYLMRRRKQS
jgi:hypothetical protein